jgi:hypothetical protein
MTDKPDEPTYLVGYQRPPVHAQFRPGQSGNEKGKMAGRRNLLTAFKRIATKKVKRRIGQSTRRMTIAEAVLLNNWQLAINGDQRALFNILPLLHEVGSIVPRSHEDRLKELMPDGKIPDYMREPWRRMTELFNERRELRAEIRRRQRLRAEKRRRDAQAQDTRDPLA